MDRERCLSGGQTEVCLEEVIFRLDQASQYIQYVFQTRGWDLFFAVQLALVSGPNLKSKLDSNNSASLTYICTVSALLGCLFIHFLQLILDQNSHLFIELLPTLWFSSSELVSV